MLEQRDIIRRYWLDLGQSIKHEERRIIMVININNNGGLNLE